MCMKPLQLLTERGGRRKHSSFLIWVTKIRLLWHLLNKTESTCMIFQTKHSQGKNVEANCREMRQWVSNPVQRKLVMVFCENNSSNGQYSGNRWGEMRNIVPAKIHTTLFYTLFHTWLAPQPQSILPCSQSKYSNRKYEMEIWENYYYLNATFATSHWWALIRTKLLYNWAGIYQTAKCKMWI